MAFPKQPFCLAALASLIVLLSGCWVTAKKSPPAPPPSQVASAPALGAAQRDSWSKVAAADQALMRALFPLPDSIYKMAALGEASVIAIHAGEATPEDLKAAYDRVDAGLRGDLKAANAMLETARAAASSDKARIAELEQQVKNEQIKAAEELRRQLAAARDEARKEADAQQRKIAAWIFYGGGFLLAVSAAVVLGTAAYVPFFGPRLAVVLGLASGVSVGLGALVNELLANPWIVRTLLGILVAAVATAGGIAYSNHFHHKTATAPTP